MVYETLLQLLSDSLVCDPDQISPQSDLQADLELNSSDLAEILNAAADEFSFTWHRQDLEEIATVGDLLSYVESRI